MHLSDSTFRVPIDIEVGASGRATRGGSDSPSQQFVPISRDKLPIGSTIMNALTMELHVVLSVRDKSVTLKTKNGSIDVGWEDVIDTAWLLVES